MNTPSCAHSSRRWVATVIAVVFGFALGCGDSAPKLATVQGKVTLNGADLDGGRIRFLPAAGAPADAEIKAGQYTIQLPPGECRVEITYPKVTGKRKAYDTPDSPMVDITEESVPAIYNSKTELKYTVTAGVNTKDFELKGKAK